MKKVMMFLAAVMMIVVANAQKPSQLPVPDLPIDERTNLVTYQVW